MNNKWEGNFANRQKGHQLVYHSDFRAFPADTFLLQSSCLLLAQTSGVHVPFFSFFLIYYFLRQNLLVSCRESGTDIFHGLFKKSEEEGGITHRTQPHIIFLENFMLLR